jgi:hypothetical protein
MVAGTPAVLEATLPRERLLRAVRLASLVPGLLDVGTPAALAMSYAPRRDITHRVDVQDHLGAKRDAMLAHTSQATAGAGPRTLELLLRLPAPAFRLVAGREWFVARVGEPRAFGELFTPVHRAAATCRRRPP